MAFFKKNETLLLFGLVISLLTIYIGTSVFYDHKYDEFVLQIEEKNEIIHELRQNVSDKNIVIFKLNAELKQQIEEGIFLEGIIENKSLENQNLNDTQEDLLKQIQRTKESLNDSKKQFELEAKKQRLLETEKDELIIELNETLVDYEEIQEDYDDILDDIESICANREVVNLDLSRCKDYS